MGVMSLGMGPDAEFTLIIDGPDEEEAMKGLEEFLDRERIAN